MSAARVGLMILLFAFHGCERPLGYHVTVRNTGHHDVNDVRVAYGNFSDAPGVLPPGIDKTHLDVHEPVPAEAVVEWRDAEGTSHREVVKVMPRSAFKGVLIFEIDGTNDVQVRTEARPRH